MNRREFLLSVPAAVVGAALITSRAEGAGWPMGIAEREMLEADIVDSRLKGKMEKRVSTQELGGREITWGSPVRYNDHTFQFAGGIPFASCPGLVIARIDERDDQGYVEVTSHDSLVKSVNPMPIVSWGNKLFVYSETTVGSSPVGRMTVSEYVDPWFAYKPAPVLAVDELVRVRNGGNWDVVVDYFRRNDIPDWPQIVTSSCAPSKRLNFSLTMEYDGQFGAPTLVGSESKCGRTFLSILLGGR